MSVASRDLLVKFLITVAAASLTLALYDAVPWTLVFFYSVITTAINYLVGDLSLLPSWGNVAAAIGDGVMAALVAYLCSELIANFSATPSTLIALGITVAVAELFYSEQITHR